MMRKLTKEEATASKPQPPNSASFVAWMNYYNDLACWKATQAERYLVGIEDTPT